MYHSLTIPRIVKICQSHHANPEYTRDRYGVYCRIRDARGRLVSTGYVHF